MVRLRGDLVSPRNTMGRLWGEVCIVWGDTKETWGDHGETSERLWVDMVRLWGVLGRPPQVFQDSPRSI